MIIKVKSFLRSKRESWKKMTNIRKKSNKRKKIKRRNRKIRSIKIKRV